VISLAVYLFILGLCFGSFVGALTWRIHKNMDFVKARSQCDICGHILEPKDLIPLFSWLYLKGKCRYCGKPISMEMPLVELTTAAIFVLSYLFWPTSLDLAGNLVLFVTWLICSVGLVALALYDLKWMLLPSKILYPTLLVAIVGQFIYLIGYAPNKLHYGLSWLAAVAVASGIFLIIFTVSSGRWIGYGDVRLGLITGTLLQTPGKSLLMIFLASVLGSLAVLPLLATGKKSLSAKLPYGPFLIFSTYLCIVFGDSLISWYQNLFLP